MADESSNKSDWAIPFLIRLCAIGWACSIFYETLNFIAPIRPIFLWVGFWATLMAFSYSIGLLFIRRNGIFITFLMVIIWPTIHFGLVMKNVAIEKQWISPALFGGSAMMESKPQLNLSNDQPIQSEKVSP